VLESSYTILVSIAITITDRSTRYPRFLVLVSALLTFRLRSIDVLGPSLREATIAIRKEYKWPTYLFIGDNNVIAPALSP